ncbi:CrcB family protein [Actinomycetes bacterium M1A6_2h]
MTTYLLVALGGGLGTGLLYAATNHRSWDSRRVVVFVNLGASALLGVLTATGVRGSVYAFVGLGLLAAFAPFTALGIESARLDEPHRLRKAVAGVLANVVAGTAAALMGYLSIRFGVVLYRKVL